MGSLSYLQPHSSLDLRSVVETTGDRSPVKTYGIPVQVDTGRGMTTQYRDVTQYINQLNNYYNTTQESPRYRPSTQPIYGTAGALSRSPFGNTDLAATPYTPDSRQTDPWAASGRNKVLQARQEQFKAERPGFFQVGEDPNNPGTYDKGNLTWRNVQGGTEAWADSLVKYDPKYGWIAPDYIFKMAKPDFLSKYGFAIVLAVAGGAMIAGAMAGGGAAASASGTATAGGTTAGGLGGAGGSGLTAAEMSALSANAASEIATGGIGAGVGGIGAGGGGSTFAAGIGGTAAAGTGAMTVPEIGGSALSGVPPSTGGTPPATGGAPPATTPPPGGGVLPSVGTAGAGAVGGTGGGGGGGSPSTTGTGGGFDWQGALGTFGNALTGGSGSGGWLGTLIGAGLSVYQAQQVADAMKVQDKSTDYSRTSGGHTSFDPSIRALQDQALAKTAENETGVMGYGTQFRSRSERTMGQYDDLYNEFQSNANPFIKARVDPMRAQIAESRGQLERNQGLRGVRGSSFANDELSKFDFTSQRELGNATSAATQEALNARSGTLGNIGGLNTSTLSGNTQLTNSLNSLNQNRTDIAGARLSQENAGLGLSAQSEAAGRISEQQKQEMYARLLSGLLGR